MRRILAVLLVLWAVPAFAANHYIRAGATGAANGSSWTDAWTTFAAVTWTRGDTYYVAGGAYAESPVIYAAESGTTWIIVRRATVAEHGTDTGWSASYASVATIQGRLSVDSSYIEVDGAVGSDNSGHGIVVANQVVGGNVVTLDYNKTHFRLYHVEIRGTGNAGTLPYGTTPENALYMNGDAAREGIHIAYCWIHSVNRDGVVVGSASGFLFEYNRVSELVIHLDPEVHGQGIQVVLYSTLTSPVFRFNRFVDLVGSAHISFLGGSTGTNVRIYGNLFWATNRDTYSVSPGVIWTRELTPTVTINGFYVYNNTFHNLKLAQIANDAAVSSNAYVRNNIWEGCEFSGGSPVHRGVTAEYNYYYNNIGTPPLGATDRAGSSTAFVDAAARNYQLVTGSLALNTGTDLGSDYAIDFAGTSRPQGAAWDMGAYEGTSSTPPNAPINVRIR